jgi:hypothetical protein
MKFSNVVGLVTGFGLVCGLAIADPLPGSLIGPGGALLNVSVTVSSDPPNPEYPVSFGFGTGGGFAATVDGYNTIVWCVDSEEDISFPTSYQADLVALPTVGTNASYVQYGNVSSWSLAADYNTALFRYEVAAYLVSEYEGFPNGPSSSDLNDQELQTAAWEMMYNSSVSSSITFGDVQDGDGAFDTSDESQIATDISNAETCVLNDNAPGCSPFNPSDFAVLSGPVTSAGNLTSGGYQTYLVDLTPVPEPSSIVLLLGALSICAILSGRRSHRKGLRD